MRAFVAISTAILIATTVSAQQSRGVVKTVTATATGEVGKFVFTVTGDNPCGAVFIDLRDGSEGVTYAITGLPYTVIREFEAVGRHRVVAKGMGNCDGEVTTEVNVTAVRPRPSPPPPPPTTPATPAPVTPPAAAMRFAGMDVDGNREISRAEWRGSARSFVFHDQNRDNKLSGAEVQLPAGELDYDKGERFDDLDTNRNNRVDRSEWHGSAAAFDSLDRNNDGALTRAETASNETSGGGRGVGAGAGTGAGANNRGRQQNTVAVPATRDWTDTGIVLQTGNEIDVTTTGQIFYSRNRSAVAQANGAAGRAATASAPMPNVEIGALIGRIGDGPVFFVGAEMSGYRAQTGGRLFLRVNDDVLTDNSGEFRAMITVRR